MKKTRDSFYVVLRDRLQALNPQRQVLIRGVLRPGVLVEDNETFAPTVPDNVFVLRWTKLVTDELHALTRTIQTCEVQYQSAGTPTVAGLDRGALMAIMDGELLSILQPQQIQKMDYTVSPPAAMGTRVSWTGPVFAPMVRERDRLVRRAEVTVVSYQEGGEI